MDKKLVWLIVGLLLIASLCVWKLVDSMGKNDQVTVSYEKGMLWLDTGTKKISMVDLKIEVGRGELTRFETNKEIFNGEMMNKVSEQGELELVLGVMKETKDLPIGKIALGRLVAGEGVILSVSGGKVTVPADGQDGPKEIEVKKGKI